MDRVLRNRTDGGVVDVCSAPLAGRGEFHLADRAFRFRRATSSSNALTKRRRRACFALAINRGPRQVLHVPNIPVQCSKTGGRRDMEPLLHGFQRPFH